MNNVLIDASVLSLALRRREPDTTVQELTEILLSGVAVIIGPVRQEVLSGISDDAAFYRLKTKLAVFDDFPIITRDYETAAAFFNTCRKHGIQGSHTDFLICAVAHNNGLLIYTTDNDFKLYAQHLPIRLYNDNNK